MPFWEKLYHETQGAAFQINVTIIYNLLLCWT